MGSSISYIAAKGALLNGSRWARLTSGSVATQYFEFATVKLASGLVVVVYKSNTDTVNWRLANPALLDNITFYTEWVNDSTNIDTFLKTIQPSQATIIASGLAYDAIVVLPNTTDETGYYSDGTGQFATTAFKEQTTAQVLAAALTASGTGTDTTTVDTVVPFYKKPLVWAIAVAVIIGGWWYSKNN
jgi:hypothetical protein